MMDMDGNLKTDAILIPPTSPTHHRQLPFPNGHMEQLYLNSDSNVTSLDVDQAPQTNGMTPQPSPLPNTSKTPVPGLRYRNLGKSGLKVSSLGLALWMLPQESPEIIESVVTLAYDSGINLFDLSDAYSGSSSEIELGKILKRRNWRRTSFVITVKIYWTSKCEERSLSRKYILDTVKGSLERLQLDYIDIVLIHRLDPNCPMEEVVRAMTHLINHGLILYWGTSKWTPQEMMEAYSNCRQFNSITPIVEQAEYHFLAREKAELYMTELYNKIGIGFMGWAPFTMNFQKLFGGPTTEDSSFTFTFRSSVKKRYPSSQSCNNKEEEAGIVPGKDTWSRSISTEDGTSQKVQQQKRIGRDMTVFAERHGFSLTQLSIAWSLKNEAVLCLLIGPTSTSELITFLHAVQLTSKLTSVVMAELEKILDNRPVRPPMVSTMITSGAFQR